MSGITVVAPVYNEPKNIGKFIDRVSEELGNEDYEIIIAEDGSDDARAILKNMRAKRCRVLYSKTRLGKGSAMGRAIEQARGDIVVCMDADLSADIRQIKRLVKGIRGGAAISVGSRLVPGSEVRRGFLRELMSRGYNQVARIALGSGVHDHQCGFKAFSRSKVVPLLKKVRAKDWFWDTELLVIAQREGLKIDEFPISWEEGGESKVRLLRDTAAMARGIIRMTLAR